MKRILLSALSLLPCYAFAQTANDDVIAHQRTLAIFGSVDYEDVEGHVHNVNYSFSPVEPISNVHININTPNPAHLSLKILDATDNIAATWSPDTLSDMYEADVNISTLSAGIYKYVIYWDSNIVKEISFSKN